MSRTNNKALELGTLIFKCHFDKFSISKGQNLYTVQRVNDLAEAAKIDFLTNDCDLGFSRLQC